MSHKTTTELLRTCTDSAVILEAVRASARASAGITDDQVDSYCLGYLASHIASQAVQAEFPLPLTDSEVNELLVSVSLSRLEQIVAERREADARALAAHVCHGLTGGPCVVCGAPATCPGHGSDLVDGVCPDCEIESGDDINVNVTPAQPFDDSRCLARLEREPGRRCVKDAGHLAAHKFSRVSTEIDKDNEL